MRPFVEGRTKPLEDDLLTEAEEQRLLSLGEQLGITTERLSAEFADVRDRLAVASVE